MIRPAIDDPTQRYRREARRLRARLADRPGELYKSLRDLSARQDFVGDVGAYGCTPKAHGRVPLSSRFADLVAAHLEEGVLRYSSRTQLLGVAQSMGIGRFQANLIIAAVRHQTKPFAQQSEPAHSHWVPAAVAVLLLQTLIIASAYVLF